MNAKFVNRSSEKRFFDPKTVLDRDEGGELEQRDFELDEFDKDMESARNMADERRRDQLSHTASAWQDELSTHRYDYANDDSGDRFDFAYNLANTEVKDPQNNPDKWHDKFKSALRSYDLHKEFSLSDDGLDRDNYEFERDFDAPYIHRMKMLDKEIAEPTQPTKSTRNDDVGDEAWERAGYQSGDMFGEAIDKLAKVTGKTELCEAVKKLYAVCHGSEK